jgi:hypothetical protein
LGDVENPHRQIGGDGTLLARAGEQSEGTLAGKRTAMVARGQDEDRQRCLLAPSTSRSNSPLALRAPLRSLQLWSFR